MLTSGLLKDYKLISLVDENIYEICWGLTPAYDNIYSWNHIFVKSNGTPSATVIKHNIINSIKSNTQNVITSNFTWKNMQVSLSKEDQLNYTAMYIAAVQTNGTSLPLTYKFKYFSNPIYYTFETVEDVTDFYIAMTKFINDNLNRGWQELDSIDWSQYK